MSLDKLGLLLNDGSEDSSFLCLRRFFILSRFFFFNDESENVEFVSGLYFPFFCGEMVKGYYLFCFGEIVKFSFPFCGG